MTRPCLIFLTLVLTVLSLSCKSSTDERPLIVDLGSVDVTADGVLLDDLSRTDIGQNVEGRERTLLELGGEADDDPTILLAEDGFAYMAFLTDRFGNEDVMITRVGQDKGWEVPVVVSQHPDVEWYPSIQQDDDGIFHMTWTRITAAPDFFRHIIYNRSSDGLSWSPDNEVSITTGLNDDTYTKILAADDALRIYFSSSVRTADGSDDLYVVSSTDGGDTWSDPAPLVALNSSETEMFPWVEPSVGGGFDIVFVRWLNTERTNYLHSSTDLFVSHSVDGMTWDPPVRVTNNDAVDTLPSLFDGELFWISTDVEGGGPIDVSVKLGEIALYPDSRIDWTESIGAAGWSPRVVPSPVAGSLIMVTVAADTGTPRLYDHWFSVD